MSHSAYLYIPASMCPLLKGKSKMSCLETLSVKNCEIDVNWSFHTGKSGHCSNTKYSIDVISTCLKQPECTLLLCVSKKNYTLFKWLPNKKIYDSGGKGLYVWVAYGLDFYITPKSPKILYAWVSTAHFWSEVSVQIILQFCPRDPYFIVT